MIKQFFRSTFLITTVAGLGVLTLATLARRNNSGSPRPPRLTEGENKRKKFAGKTRDLVDENSWESFPASDPPSTY